ncbi:hypothetical protein SAMN04487998_2663 [Hymenobacter actinosclerus]|uniref:Uncharacterized protein n=2 Tax=Hymenobacter actinosclerus TaxID=82805 RepID=A0A1I0GYW7_9BACT|nr:hypothetical protein SAMN04487998_2663 [Hymenobacter actinosclerus]
MLLILMVRRVPLLLLAGMLLASLAGRAQQASSPRAQAPKPALPPPRQQRTLTVHLPLPTLVARLGEATGLLERPAAKNRRAGAAEPVPDDPVLVFTLPLPKLFSSRPAAAPTTATAP